MRKPVYAAGVKVFQSPLQRIIEKTGRRPCECKCRLCKMQCRTPCLGTPQDILRLMDAGYTDRLYVTEWAAGIMLGVTNEIVLMIQAEQVGGSDLDPNAHCTFFHDGLCDLHNLGLKPTEGRLSHHSQRIDNFKRNRSISWAVAQEWLSPDNADVVAEVFRRYQEYKKSADAARRK